MSFNGKRKRSNGSGERASVDCKRRATNANALSSAPHHLFIPDAVVTGTPQSINLPTITVGSIASPIYASQAPASTVAAEPVTYTMTALETFPDALTPFTPARTSLSMTTRAKSQKRKRSDRVSVSPNKALRRDQDSGSSDPTQKHRAAAGDAQVSATHVDEDQDSDLEDKFDFDLEIVFPPGHKQNLGTLPTGKIKNSCRKAYRYPRTYKPKDRFLLWQVEMGLRFFDQQGNVVRPRPIGWLAQQEAHQIAGDTAAEPSIGRFQNIREALLSFNNERTQELEDEKLPEYDFEVIERRKDISLTQSEPEHLNVWPYYQKLKPDNDLTKFMVENGLRFIDRWGRIIRPTLRQGGPSVKKRESFSIPLTEVERGALVSFKKIAQLHEDVKFHIREYQLMQQLYLKSRDEDFVGKSLQWLRRETTRRHYSMVVLKVEIARKQSMQQQRTVQEPTNRTTHSQSKIPRRVTVEGSTKPSSTPISSTGATAPHQPTPDPTVQDILNPAKSLHVTKADNAPENISGWDENQSAQAVCDIPEIPVAYSSLNEVRSEDNINKVATTHGSSRHRVFAADSQQTRIPNPNDRWYRNPAQQVTGPKPQSGTTSRVCGSQLPRKVSPNVNFKQQAPYLNTSGRSSQPLPSGQGNSQRITHTGERLGHGSPQSITGQRIGIKAPESGFIEQADPSYGPRHFEAPLLEHETSHLSRHYSTLPQANTQIPSPKTAENSAFRVLNEAGRQSHPVQPQLTSQPPVFSRPPVFRQTLMPQQPPTLQPPPMFRQPPVFPQPCYYPSTAQQNQPLAFPQQRADPGFKVNTVQAHRYPHLLGKLLRNIDPEGHDRHMRAAIEYVRRPEHRQTFWRVSDLDLVLEEVAAEQF